MLSLDCVVWGFGGNQATFGYKSYLEAFGFEFCVLVPKYLSNFHLCL